MSLSRADLVGGAPRKPIIRSVAVAEWATEGRSSEECVVLIKRMTGTERDAYEIAMSEWYKTQDRSNMRARLVVRCICDENGGLVLTPDDAEALGQLDGVALNRVAEACQKLNGIGDSEMEKAVGNSEPALGAAP